MVEVNGTIFFGADDGVHGRELWKSDGSTAGTVMVKDIDPSTYLYDGYGEVPPSSSDPYSLTDFNGTLFFSASEGANGEELWKSDGTASGTVMVADIFPGINPGPIDGGTPAQTLLVTALIQPTSQ